jgi:hypothetical protein
MCLCKGRMRLRNLRFIAVNICLRLRQHVKVFRDNKLNFLSFINRGAA